MTNTLPPPGADDQHPAPTVPPGTVIDPSGRPVGFSPDSPIEPIEHAGGAPQSVVDDSGRVTFTPLSEMWGPQSETLRQSAESERIRAEEAAELAQQEQQQQQQQQQDEPPRSPSYVIGGSEAPDIEPRPGHEWRHVPGFTDYNHGWGRWNEGRWVQVPIEPEPSEPPAVEPLPHRTPAALDPDSIDYGTHVGGEDDVRRPVSGIPTQATATVPPRDDAEGARPDATDQELPGYPPGSPTVTDSAEHDQHLRDQAAAQQNDPPAQPATPPVVTTTTPPPPATTPPPLVRLNETPADPPGDPPGTPPAGTPPPAPEAPPASPPNPPGGPPGHEGGGGNPPEQPPSTAQERLLHDGDLHFGMDRIVRLQMRLEGKVGWGKKRASAELKEAETELKEYLLRMEMSREDRLELKSLVDVAIARERIRRAPEKIKGFLPRVGHTINRVTRWMGRHKKIVIPIVAVAAVAATGGIVAGVALGAGATVGTWAAIGGGIGAVKGAITGYLKGLGVVAEQNLRSSVRQRVRPSDFWHRRSLEFRNRMGEQTRKSTTTGAAIGAAAGALAGGGIAGLAEVVGGAGAEGLPEPPEFTHDDAEAAIRVILDEDPSKISTIPGLEDVDVNPLTQEEAGNMYPGRYPWDSLQHGADLDNGATLKAFTEGWTKLDQVPGINVDTWGDIQAVDGNYQTTGDLWGGSMTVENVFGVEPDGDLVPIEDGQLTTSEHAAVLDMTREGVQIIDADQLADQLADKVNLEEAAQRLVEPQAEAIVQEFSADLDAAGTSPDAGEPVMAAAINEVVAEHPRQFVEMSSEQFTNYLGAMIDAQVRSVMQNVPEWVHPDAIQRMLEEAINSVKAQ